MRLVFLDIDGVLNSGDFYRRSPTYAPLDRAAIARLNRIIRQSGASVVVSSTWRHRGLPMLRDQLGAAGYSGRLYGVTPFIGGSPRGDEIAAWLERSRRPVERFVILDDDDDMGHLLPHLIRTDWRHGLTEADVEQAIARLTP